MDASAERRQHAQPPVADLVAEALDHDRAVRRDHARGSLLLLEELDQVAGCAAIEVVLALERLGLLVDRPAGERADRLTELLRAADAVALPERDRAGQPGRRRDDHAVAADLLDPPGARAEQERLARAAPRRPSPRRARRRRRPSGSVTAYRPRSGIVPALVTASWRAPGPSPERARDPVPHDPRAQLGELGGRVAAVEHVEHVLERVAAAARRRSASASTSAYRSSTATGSSSGAAAAIATICWASTSSALRGTTVVSISPARIRLATTAHSSRSARNFGKIRPRLTSPTEWPARPIRCRPRATDFGDSTWITRSTAPMSIPSSSDEVATRHGSSPALSSSSTTVRSSRASEPWWARAISALGQVVEPQRQALGARGGC